jgi:hypothetical protein
MSKTPLTDHYTKRLRNLCDDEFVPIEFARKLERELVAVTEQRDRLAEALLEIDEARLDDFMGPHDMALKCVLISREALEAVEGGSHDH